MPDEKFSFAVWVYCILYITQWGPSQFSPQKANLKILLRVFMSFYYESSHKNVNRSVTLLPLLTLSAVAPGLMLPLGL